ncbi:MAG: putative DNA binding domain-containing protein [Bacteroidales bacterium]|nr:putative DNA binding domain-containing protein [Bacteroidales bacterium]
MTSHEIKEKLHELLALEAETEVVEFKEAKNQYDFTKLGKYFSALSNEANLKNKTSAWLVFGVNKKHQVVGSQFRKARKDLDHLKGEIANKMTNRITFIEIYEVNHPNGRVVLLEIPPAPKGIPIAFEGHYYGRDGEELVPLNIEEIERIRKQDIVEDWTAKIIPNASLNDLDSEAISKARKQFKQKYPKLADDVDKWDDITFLNRAKITIDGKITRTAILLLGKPESTHYLLPSVAEITWKLDAEEKAYEHFTVPFLLTTTQVMQRIRNVQVRFYPDFELLATTVNKYDTKSILEAIHNCVAHQDYSLRSRIIVTEKVDKLIFSNAGSFFEGKPEEYSLGDKTPNRYRNPWLVHAMFNLGMIDRLGYGIHTLYVSQRNRFFPLPDYILTDPQMVVMYMYGQAIDENYSKTLIEKRSDLDLSEVVLLDRVQKHLEITDKAVEELKKKKLIEGRKPNYFIGAKISQSTGRKAEYSRNKAFEKQQYVDWVLKSIKEHGCLNRQDINKLLWNMLPEWMSEKQKKNKVKNLITELRVSNKIRNTGSKKEPVWILEIRN